MNPVFRSLHVPSGMRTMLEEAMDFVAQQDKHTKAAIDVARDAVREALSTQTSTAK